MVLCICKKSRSPSTGWNLCYWFLVAKAPLCKSPKLNRCIQSSRQSTTISLPVTGTNRALEKPHITRFCSLVCLGPSPVTWPWHWHEGFKKRQSDGHSLFQQNLLVPALLSHYPLLSEQRRSRAEKTSRATRVPGLPSPVRRVGRPTGRWVWVCLSKQTLQATADSKMKSAQLPSTKAGTHTLKSQVPSHGWLRELNPTISNI